MEEFLKWFVLTLAYYGTGIFFISRYWRRTRKRLPTLAMLAGLWLLAGWDVYFVYPWYGDYCEKEAMIQYHGPCVDDLDKYDCHKFSIMSAMNEELNTCPLISDRNDNIIIGLIIRSTKVYDIRCGKIVYEEKEKFQYGSIGTYFFPLFTWATGGQLLLDRCFEPRQFWDYQLKLEGRKK